MSKNIVETTLIIAIFIAIAGGILCLSSEDSPKDVSEEDSYNVIEASALNKAGSLDDKVKSANKTDHEYWINDYRNHVYVYLMFDESYDIELGGWYSQSYFFYHDEKYGDQIVRSFLIRPTVTGDMGISLNVVDENHNVISSTYVMLHVSNVVNSDNFGILFSERIGKMTPLGLAK